MYKEHNGLVAPEAAGMLFKMLKFIVMLQELIFAKGAVTEVLTNAIRTRLNAKLIMPVI